MKQIRVLIIDDERIAIEVIKELIVQLTTDLTVVGTARNGLEAIEQIAALQPDLVFMDINMPLMNGMEALQNLSDRTFHLVFTTGFDAQPQKTARYGAIDTLLKPIDPAEFLTAVEKVRQHLVAGGSPGR